MYGCTAMRIQLTQTSHFLACTQRQAKTIRWWYSLYITLKGVLHASTKFKHLLWAMYKKKPHQNPTCSLFSWRAHTWHVAGTTCTSDSSHLGKLQRRSWCKAESRQASRAAAKIFTTIPPNNTKKSDTSPSEYADTCGCLLALTTLKWSLGFRASRIFLDQGKWDSAS